MLQESDAGFIAPNTTLMKGDDVFGLMLRQDGDLESGCIKLLGIDDARPMNGPAYDYFGSKSGVGANIWVKDSERFLSVQSNLAHSMLCQTGGLMINISAADLTLIKDRESLVAIVTDYLKNPNHVDRINQCDMNVVIKL